MEYDLFKERLGKLVRWCNKKINDTQQDIYWDAIEKIPDIAFTEIVDNMIKEIPPSGKLPTPDNITLSWYYWRQAHPSSIAPEERAWCDDCSGEGVFTIWYQDYIVPKEQIPPEKDPDNYIFWYKTFVPCSQCQNWKRHFPTKGSSIPKKKYTQQDIIYKGWRLTDPAFVGNKLIVDVVIKRDDSPTKHRDMSELSEMRGME